MIKLLLRCKTVNRKSVGRSFPGRSMTTTHPLRMCKSHVMNEMFVVVVVVAVIIVNIIIEKNHSISASMKFYEKKVVFFFFFI